MAGLSRGYGGYGGYDRGWGWPGAGSGSMTGGSGCVTGTVLVVKIAYQGQAAPVTPRRRGRRHPSRMTVDGGERVLEMIAGGSRSVVRHARFQPDLIGRTRAFISE